MSRFLLLLDFFDLLEDFSALFERRDEPLSLARLFDGEAELEFVRLRFDLLGDLEYERLRRDWRSRDRDLDLLTNIQGTNKYKL